MGWGGLWECEELSWWVRAFAFALPGVVLPGVGGVGLGWSGGGLWCGVVWDWIIIRLFFR